MKYDFTLSWSKFLQIVNDVVSRFENEYKDSIVYIDFFMPTTISGAPFRNEFYIAVQKYGEYPKSYHVGYAIVYPYANSEWVADVHFFRLSEIRPSIYSSFEGLIVGKVVKEIIKLCGDVA